MGVFVIKMLIMLIMAVNNLEIIEINFAFFGHSFKRIGSDRAHIDCAVMA